MIKKKPLVSICIPCYKRLDQVKRTLNSLYIDNADVPLNEYEVILSDNDSKCELESIIVDFSDKSNLRYIRTKCDGFMNSYYALTYGQGDLLKLHNSQNIIRKGMLSEIIRIAKDTVSTKTLIFHSNGFLSHYRICHYHDFNDFMGALSYWSSWSGGMTIWKEDFENIGNIIVNPLFPHTSVLLTQYNKKSFLIDDRVMYEVQRIAKRGGHNKFEAFTIEYPSLIDKSYQEGYISDRCRKIIFRSLYQNYIPTLLFNKYIARIETFDATGFKQNSSKYLHKHAYLIAWMNVIFVPFRLLLRRVNKILHS